MLASHIPAVDILWQTLVAVVQLHDEDDHPWEPDDLADLGVPGIQSASLLDVLNEGRVERDTNRAKRSGVQARLYFGHDDEAACPRMFIGEGVESPSIEQWCESRWLPYEARYTQTRIGLFADLDIPIVGSKLRLLDGQKEIRHWNLTGEFPGFVFSKRGGAIVDAKTVDNAGIFSGDRLCLFHGTPVFDTGIAATELDFVWGYHDSTMPWTAWKVSVPGNAQQLQFVLNGEEHEIPICRDQYSPIFFSTEPCDTAAAISQDGHVMPLYSTHPIVEQSGAREMTVVCDLEGSRFTLKRKNYRRKLEVCGGEPLTDGAGIFQIRRQRFPQLEVARYAVIPGFQIESLEPNVSKRARFEIKADENLGVFTCESDSCELIHEAADGRWILETNRDQPIQELLWRPRIDAEDESSQPGEPVRLRVSIEGVRWRLVSKADGSRVPTSNWTNKRIPVRQDVANREAMELDVCVPRGWQLIANDQTLGARPSRIAAGDVYRIRLAGQDRPKFQTPDGTIYEPAIVSVHPVISSSRLDQKDGSSLIQVSGEGEFLNDVSVWGWETLDLQSPLREANIASDGKSFVFEFPTTERTLPINTNARQVYSFAMGRRGSDGLFEDSVDYAKEDRDGMRLHSGWIVSCCRSGDGTTIDQEIVSLKDATLGSFHRHRLSGIVSDQAPGTCDDQVELGDQVFTLACNPESEIECSQLAILDRPSTAIPWQYLSDVTLLRDEFVQEMSLEERRSRRSEMQKAAERVFDFHERNDLVLPHVIMPLYFAGSLGKASSESIGVLGWRNQSDFEIEPPGDHYYEWLQALGINSIRFKNGRQGETNQQVTWRQDENSLSFQEAGKETLRLPGRMEFTPLKDEALPRIPSTLAIAASLHSRLDRSSLLNSCNVVTRDLANAIQLDCEPIHQRVRRTRFEEDSLRDPLRHAEMTLHCIWSLSWAIASALTGNKRYQTILHESDSTELSQALRQQPSAFRIGIALAALIQAVVFDGGLGCAARYQVPRHRIRPR